MSKRESELKIQMAEMIRQWRTIMDKADDEHRDLTNDENVECMRLDAEVGLIKEKIEADKRANGNRHSLEKHEEWARTPAGLDIRGLWPSGAVQYIRTTLSWIDARTGRQAESR